MARNGEKKSIQVLYLVLGILCQLSIRDSTIALLIIFLFLLLFLLFTDQKLLWRPAKFPAFDFSLRWLNYNGWQAVFELTATVKVWRVREYLTEERQGECADQSTLRMLQNSLFQARRPPTVKPKIMCEHISNTRINPEPRRRVAGTITRLNNCEGSDGKTKHLWREVVA